MTTWLALLVCLAAWLALTWLLMTRSGLARSVRRSGRYLLVVALVVAGVAISLLGVWQSFSRLGPSWRAAMGQGTEGTFTSERVDFIGRGGDQQWRGTFISTDHSIVRYDVVLDNPPNRMQIGSAIPARDTGARGVVYGHGIPFAVVRDLLVLPLVLLGWIVCGWLLVARLAGRRLGRHVKRTLT